MAEWIWLDKGKYPNHQHSFLSPFAEDKAAYSYAVAEFKAAVSLKPGRKQVRLRVSADVNFRLWINGAFACVGPASAGGDFDCVDAMPVHYASVYSLDTNEAELAFFAQVSLLPSVMTEWSRGHGGFFLEGSVTYEDGTSETFGTDEGWQGRRNGAYLSPDHFDMRVKPDAWGKPARVDDRWHVVDAPIPLLDERFITPQGAQVICVPPKETVVAHVAFDKIYAGYVLCDVKGSGNIRVECFEVPGKDSGAEELVVVSEAAFRSLKLHSIGEYRIRIENTSDGELCVKPGLLFTCYPVKERAVFETSDALLNKIHNVCTWTLQICRQTLHLDSPLHQEPLACTGDYYIETLMTAFTFGDLRLAAFDVVRTANWLKQNGGVMFHTSYSLIWVQMMAFVYCYTADKALLFQTKDGLLALLNRFAGYMGDNGVVDHPPNYMFVDWMEVEGYSLHHPPKALGQTALNAFYHGALVAAADLFDVMGEVEEAGRCRAKAAALRTCFNESFFDEAKGLYIDGLSTPGAVNKWQPENIALRHFSFYGNTLAVLYGLCDEAQGQRIMIKLLEDDAIQPVQPYFMHFVLEAVHKTGLFERYGLELIRRWEQMVDQCDKGLKEGWFAPQEGYAFDYSHAWGGTPAYQLPARLLGFEMLEPGFAKIRLAPRLYGLEWANLTMPTPFGDISCSMRKGQVPQVEVPEGIEYTVDV